MPLVATPVGGLAEIVAPGVTGWLARATGAEALRELLGPLVAEPARVRGPRDASAVRAHLDALADPDAMRAAYMDLCGARRPASRPETPLVSAVVCYSGRAQNIEAAVASVVAQTYPRIEIIVVNGGAFDPADAVLAELAARHPLRVLSQDDRGPGAARNFGIAQSRGRHVLVLDADATLEPTFVARAATLLESDDALAYVTAWNDDERPVGNWTALVQERDVTGGSVAVLRRGACDFSEDLTGATAWMLLRELHRAGRHGHVIPEVLWHAGAPGAAGVVDDGELDALLREREVAWMP
jgi:hypothetical protein